MRGQSASRHGRLSGGDEDDSDPPPAREAAGLAAALRRGAVSRRRRRDRRNGDRSAVRRSCRRKARSRAACAHCGFPNRLAVPEEAVGWERHHQGVDDRDHGARADAARARVRRVGLHRNGQRLGNGPLARTGGALRVRTGQRRRRRRGRGPAREAGRYRRRRALRLSAPLRRRTRPRGQPGCH